MFRLGANINLSNSYSTNFVSDSIVIHDNKSIVVSSTRVTQLDDEERRRQLTNMFSKCALKYL